MFSHYWELNEVGMHCIWTSRIEVNEWQFPGATSFNFSNGNGAWASFSLLENRYMQICWGNFLFHENFYYPSFDFEAFNISFFFEN